MRHIFLLAFIAALAIGVIACASQIKSRMQSLGTHLSGSAHQAQVNAAATFPPGPEGELVRYGHDLIADTPRLASHNITAQMSCSACHVADGRQPHAGSFLGTYARFPQWSKRANRFILLQDRLAECFLYSMNGKPPAYYSKEMVAMTAYIAWLSRGAPTSEGFPDQDPVVLKAGLQPDAGAGAQLYAARCVQCHGVDGAGAGLRYPPLWGPKSFNDGAGMSHVNRLAPFIRVAMPQNSPGTLTDQQALDVAAFILSKPRPHFKKSRLVDFPAQRADYF